jgi:hypothetical protein
VSPPSFGALKLGIDFSLAMEVLGGIFFQQKMILSTAAASFTHDLSHSFWMAHHNFSVSTCCFVWHFQIVDMTYFLTTYEQTPLASIFSSAPSSLLLDS